MARYQGDLQGAAAQLRESLALAQNQGAAQHSALALLGLAELAAATGAAARATWLFGAVTALYARLGIRLGVPDAADLAVQVATVRAALGEAAFSAAWTAGQAAPTAAVIATALTPMDGG